MKKARLERKDLPDAASVYFPSSFVKIVSLVLLLWKWEGARERERKYHPYRARGLTIMSSFALDIKYYSIWCCGFDFEAAFSFRLAGYGILYCTFRDSYQLEYGRSLYLVASQ